MRAAQYFCAIFPTAAVSGDFAVRECASGKESSLALEAFFSSATPPSRSDRDWPDLHQRRESRSKAVWWEDRVGEHPWPIRTKCHPPATQATACPQECTCTYLCTRRTYHAGLPHWEVLPATSVHDSVHHSAAVPPFIVPRNTRNWASWEMKAMQSISMPFLHEL